MHWEDHCVWYSVSASWVDLTASEMWKLLIKLKLSTLQKWRQQFHLVSCYKVVKELVLAIPTNLEVIWYLPPKKQQQTKKKTQQQQTIETDVRNNDKCFNVLHCLTEQLKNCFHQDCCEMKPQGLQSSTCPISVVNFNKDRTAMRGCTVFGFKGFYLLWPPYISRPPLRGFPPLRLCQYGATVSKLKKSGMETHRSSDPEIIR